MLLVMIMVYCTCY